jgi:hypothetical protein
MKFNDFVPTRYRRGWLAFLLVLIAHVVIACTGTATSSVGGVSISNPAFCTLSVLSRA